MIKFDDLECVFTIKIDLDLIKKLEYYYKNYIKDQDKINYHIVSPSWNSDIKWISIDSLKFYNFFKKNIFEKLDLDFLRKVIDIDKEIRLYSVFFVTRSYCNKPNFHFDFENTNFNGYTLMTPINEDNDQGNLLYKKNGKEKVYKYKRGECIIFGDFFEHSTQPYQGKEMTFFCLTFGSDKEIHWKNIFGGISTQSKNVMRFDNEFINCNEEINKLQLYKKNYIS